MFFAGLSETIYFPTLNAGNPHPKGYPPLILRTNRVKQRKMYFHLAAKVLVNSEFTTRPWKDRSLKKMNAGNPHPKGYPPLILRTNRVKQRKMYFHLAAKVLVNSEFTTRPWKDRSLKKKIGRTFTELTHYPLVRR